MLDAPVLQLDAAKMHQIDPRNVESLFGMWTVFSKCANTIPDGKRLENLSWRLWARETLCCPPQPERTIVPAIDVPIPRSEDVPDLSNSPGSVDTSGSYLENSALSKSRGNESHLTPYVLERLVATIKDTTTDTEEGQQTVPELGDELKSAIETILSPEIKGKAKNTELRPSPLSTRSSKIPCTVNAESSCVSTTSTSIVATSPENERKLLHRGSVASTSSDGLIRSDSGIVHGFQPASSTRSRSSLNHMVATMTQQASNAWRAPSKKPYFTLGGSSEDDDSSLDQQMSQRRDTAALRKSSLSQNLTVDRPQQKKTATFKEIVEQGKSQQGTPNNDSAVESDDDDDLDDSAIEDEDDDGWEDSAEEEDEKSLSMPEFKRVDSTVHLPSRRSILTQGLTEGDRAKGFINAAKSTGNLLNMNRPLSLQASKDPTGVEREDAGLMMRSIGAKPIPILSPPVSPYAMAHSPRTTRRHMLSTELPESLRKNLLWERQQKSTTVNAFLNRQAKSMANLPSAGRQIQQAQAESSGQRAFRPSLDTTDEPPETVNDYFNTYSNEYHSKGW